MVGTRSSTTAPSAAQRNASQQRGTALSGEEIEREWRSKLEAAVRDIVVALKDVDGGGRRNGSVFDESDSVSASWKAEVVEEERMAGTTKKRTARVWDRNAGKGSDRRFSDARVETKWLNSALEAETQEEVESLLLAFLVAKKRLVLIDTGGRPHSTLDWYSDEEREKMESLMFGTDGAAPNPPSSFSASSALPFSQSGAEPEEVEPAEVEPAEVEPAEVEPAEVVEPSCSAQAEVAQAEVEEAAAVEAEMEEAGAEYPGLPAAKRQRPAWMEEVLEEAGKEGHTTVFDVLNTVIARMRARGDYVGEEDAEEEWRV